MFGPATRGLGSNVERLTAPFAEEITGPSVDPERTSLASNLDYTIVIEVPIDLPDIFIQLSVLSVSLSCDTDSVKFYDGDCDKATCTFISSICGDTPPPDWIVSSSNKLTLKIVTGNYDPTGDVRAFKGMYYSNHYKEATVTSMCGLTRVPFVSRAKSMYERASERATRSASERAKRSASERASEVKLSRVKRARVKRAL